MTTDENDFDPQSPIECCIGARVDAMEAEILATKARVSTFDGISVVRWCECAGENRSI
jgi:hypothetical protein